jgi:hypothetical protein
LGAGVIMLVLREDDGIFRTPPRFRSSALRTRPLQTRPHQDPCQTALFRCFQGKIAVPSQHTLSPRPGLDSVEDGRTAASIRHASRDSVVPFGPDQLPKADRTQIPASQVFLPGVDSKIFDTLTAIPTLAIFLLSVSAAFRLAFPGFQVFRFSSSGQRPPLGQLCHPGRWLAEGAVGSALICTHSNRALNPCTHSKLLPLDTPTLRVSVPGQLTHHHFRVRTILVEAAVPRPIYEDGTARASKTKIPLGQPVHWQWATGRVPPPPHNWNPRVCWRHQAARQRTALFRAA